ncbi:hypothetical protein ACHAWF_009875 [Thalassiosira exigua]
MHPPLDRPHPDCQREIDDLRHCHATTSKLKFWGCNEVKYALDRCFKEEKRRQREVIFKDAEAKRAAEERAYQAATGKQLTFEEYLKQDKDWNKAVEERRRREAEQN